MTVEHQILLVEDDVNIQQTLVDILEEHGFAVTAASSIADARRRAAPTEDYAVALIDIMLPDGSGLRLARELREARPELDIVLITANASLETAIDAVAVGAFRYLQKPCHPRVVIQVFEEILERRSLQDEAQRQSRRVQLVYDLLGQLVGVGDPGTVACVGAETIRLATGATLTAVVAKTAAETPPRTWVVGQPPAELAAQLADPTWLAGLAATVQADGPQCVRGVWSTASSGTPSDSVVVVMMSPPPSDVELVELMCRQISSAFQRAIYHEQLHAAYDRLRTQQQTLVEAEKHSAVGRLAAGVAHEIGTPLNIISGRAETLLGKVDTNSALADGLRIIVRQIDRIAILVRQLLDYSRTDSGDGRAPIRLSAVLADTLPLLQTRAMQRMVTIENRVPALGSTIVASFHQLQQVILNLVLNAVDAESKTIVLDAEVVGRGQTLRLTVTDDGTGIPEEHLEMIFEPFFTTKARGEGTGLGLAVVRGIVRDHGGRITAERVPTGGTRFCVELPLAP